jgi:hypothetical protein
VFSFACNGVVTRCCAVVYGTPTGPPRSPRIAEQAFAAPQHHGEHHDPVLVDEVVLDEGVQEVGAAVEHDVASGLLLQLGDLLDGVSAEDDRVLPRRRLQAPGDDVLRDVVHPIGEAFVLWEPSARTWQNLVGHASQEDGLGREDLVDLVSLLILAGVPEGSGVLAVRMRLRAWAPPSRRRASRTRKRSAFAPLSGQSVAGR